MSHRAVKSVVVMTLLAAAGATLWRYLARDSDLPDGVTRRQWELTARAFEHRYGRRPDRVDTLSLLAEMSTAAHDERTALACFGMIPSSDRRYGHSARYQQAQILVRLNKARPAEDQLRELFRLEEVEPKLKPSDLAEARRLLRFLLEVQLRFEERHELLRGMIERAEGERFDVLAYCFPSLLRWNGPQAVEWLEGFWKEDPENLVLRTALGRYRTAHGRMDEAFEILTACYEERPDDLAASAALLAWHQQRDDWEAMESILAALPRMSDREPWLLTRIRGHIHNHFKRFAEAEECFLAILQRDPANAESHLGLAAAYAGLKRSEQRQNALRRANLLARIQNRLGWATGDDAPVQPFLEIAALCEQLELTEQALAMAGLVLHQQPQNEDAKALVARIRKP